MNYGPDRLIQELKDEGYELELMKGRDNQDFVVIQSFLIPVGQFKGKVVDLGIPAPNDYGRSVGASIHLRSVPHLLDMKDTIPAKRNIIASPLGEEWRYWSHRFTCDPANTTRSLLSQINRVFRDV